MTPTQPLLRLAASPFDSHMLATFASDSNLIRILNSIEWSPHKRGMLASGGDDSLVMTWDLINQENQAVLPSINGNGANVGDIPIKGPSSSWQCEYEVGNVSFAPESMLTAQGGDWLGVCAGRGVWGVKL
jgi:WD repeat-containing protein 68